MAIMTTRFKNDAAIKAREFLKQGVEFRLASYFSSLRNPFESQHYKNNFVQDLSVALMPLGVTRGDFDRIKIKFNGETGEVEKAFLAISDFCEHEPRDYENLICDAVNSIARDVCWDGTALYEVAKIEKQNVKSYFVRSFTNESLIEIPFLYYIQIVPKLDQQFIKGKYRFCSYEDVFKVTIPNELGGSFKYSRLLAELNKYSSYTPGFYKDHFEKSLEDKTYNSGKYLDDKAKFIFAITKEWGWNARDYSNKYNNEYFHVYRYIRHKWACSVLRNHLIETLNVFLKRVEINASFIVEGLMMPNEILNLQTEMENGRSDFTDIVKMLR